MIAYFKKSQQLHSEQVKICLLLAAFAVSVCLRIGVGGKNVAYSWTAGVVFAASLYAISKVAEIKTVVNYRVIFIGLASGIFLLIPALLSGPHQAHPAGNYVAWSAVVTFVACAEEMFLRGVLYGAITKIYSENWAIFIAAAAFGLLHVPLYGWHAMPLDFFVGIYLGTVRSISGSWVAPGIVHSLADLVGWWLV